MLTILMQSDYSIQELADHANVAYQTAWRWIEQQIDLGNVVAVIKGKNGGGGRVQATRFGWIGSREEQADALLYRAADYIALSNPCALGRNLSNEINAWLRRS